MHSLESAEINYINDNKIEIIGELDPDVEIHGACLNEVVPKTSTEIKVFIPMDLKDLENFFRWAAKKKIGEYEGKWKLILERLD